jgi:hypothetical protein
MADAIPYRLKFPFIRTVQDLDGAREVEVASLALAPRVKGKHLARTDGAKGPTAARIALIAALASLTVAEANELDQDDLEGIEAVYDEQPTDLMRVAEALGLDPKASIGVVLAAITGKAPEAVEPIGPLAGSRPVGPSTGGSSSAI